MCAVGPRSSLGGSLHHPSPSLPNSDSLNAVWLPGAAPGGGRQGPGGQANRGAGVIVVLDARADSGSSIGSRGAPWRPAGERGPALTGDGGE